ncbi:PF06250 domain protein [Leptospira weilii serovar Topaz str. LT2116]|uniref:PF06250 domain protein n=1 Tax=Leptospira weilii serovar Topaz str. LT2116 TaxID=1088540 RepID=M3G1W0_9LEPT|nr:PF06250 domain protein [Leptospira weilii serovar Topaz str. LT2116]
MKYNKIKILADQIAEIFKTLEENNYKGSNRFTLEAARKIGNLLNREFLGQMNNLENRSKMKDLSDAISKRVSKGFSRRTLYYSLKFYQSYRNKKLDYRLSWSHYRILASISDKDVRRKLEKQSIQENWTRIILEKKARESGYYGTLKQYSRKRPTGEILHYKVVTGKLNPKSKWLDFGFHFYEKLNGKNDYQEGDILKVVSDKDGWNYHKSKLPHAFLYHYLGNIERVIDGDTVLACLELGCGRILRERIRLLGVNAAELGTMDGEAAFRALKRKLKVGSSILIKTHSQDKYGRYLGDILYLKEKKPNYNKLKSEGFYLNEELAGNGY